MRASRADIISHIAASIQTLYTRPECLRIARMIAAAISGDKETTFIIEPNEIIDIDIEQATKELAEGRPVQYIIGKTEFCGEEFIVREGALIPRPETEELVLWASEKAQQIQQPKVLDLCTGSGCIAISLKKFMPQASIVAVDLSSESLAIAQENAAKLNTPIEFIQDDVLQGVQKLSGKVFDIIVSNPPYIPLSERDTMHINVTRYEPDMALFVADDDPLIFYREIARAAKTMLSEGGSLLFEIHELLAEQTLQMLLSEGFEASLRHDFRSKPRMICCHKKE